MIPWGGMRTPPIALQHPEATRERLVALVKELPGAWIGIKIAALLLMVEGQRPGWITEVLGLTRMSLNRWRHGVNAQGLHALVPKVRPGRPPPLTASVRQLLARHLEQSPQTFGLPRVQWDGSTLEPVMNFKSLIECGYDETYTLSQRCP